METSVHIIGIAGGSGSGKTTFAQKIYQNIGPQNCCLLPMDSYYLPKSLVNYDHPEAFDWELLISHLEALKAGENVPVPIYDYVNNRRTKETRSIGGTPIVLFEGILTLYDIRVRGLLDISCFLHVDSDVRFIRRLQRDTLERGRSMESVISQYHATVRPMYKKYLGQQRQYANFVVGEETHIAAGILVARIKELLDADAGSLNSTRPYAIKHDAFIE